MRVAEVSMSGPDPAGLWVRAPAAHVVAQRERLLVVGDDGAVREVAGASAELVEAVLEILDEPRDRDAVLAAVVERAGALVDPAIVDEALALLRAAGAIQRAAMGAAPAAFRDGPRVVLGLSGSIGALHTPLVVAALHRRGCDVQIAATRSALKFVPAVGLEALTHRRVVRSLWSRDPTTPVPHLALAAWAELMIVCPATASTIARLATGDHGCVVAAAALVARVPVVIAPAMNPAMLDEPAVQRNLAQLRADGFYVVPPGLGVEIAEAPGARVMRAGGAPPAERMAELALAVLRSQPAPTGGAIDWEAEHAAAATGPDEVALDDELLARVSAHAAPPGLLLDIGTGGGAVAAWAARRGFAVVATELSPTALARAHARHAGLPITWLLDDITDSRLRGSVAVAIDRGVLHHLPVAALPRWAHTVARLVAPGGALFVKTDAAARRGTRVVSVSELDAVLGAAFERVETRGSWFVGRLGTTPAQSIVLRRRG